jgi:hypothetical protein
MAAVMAVSWIMLTGSSVIDINKFIQWFFRWFFINTANNVVIRVLMFLLKMLRIYGMKV